MVRWNKQTGERRLGLLTWGLVPHFAKEPEGPRPAPINARAETVASSGMFRGALRDRRCITPAAAFYEWKAEAGGKQPFAIITTTANPIMQQVHERMPVVLLRGMRRRG